MATTSDPDHCMSPFVFRNDSLSCLLLLRRWSEYRAYSNRADMLIDISLFSILYISFG